MKYAVDQTHIRSINQRIILDKIYSKQLISRAELARELRISKAAVTENIASLLSKGIIQEVGTGVSMASGGRKPILLKFSNTYQYIISIELKFEDPLFVLADLDGKILNKITMNIPGSSSYPARLELVLNAVNFLISSSNLTHSDLAIIAISCPGIYNPESRSFLANANFANWNMGDLSQQLESHFETSVLVSNDVNAAALGEFTYGAGKASKDLVYISGGLGLGAGLILNGSIYGGTSNSAGEIAHEITIENDIKQARKYAFNNLGGSTNINALTTRVKQDSPKKTEDAFAALGKTLDTFNFKDLVKVWQSGDPFLTQCIEDISVIIGGTISNIVCLLNCDLVIFGGEYSVFNSQMLPNINRIVKENAFMPIDVVPAELEENSGIYGLFALSRDFIFNKLCQSDLSK
ncbi:ROK family transcriptional regulator [Paenibacillus puldeungensis]|uniref:ROK family transcriptional regulator n=1 Tax=Paenibacillus puldeungensis TaxID=696536 RepID=A0ABW3RQZ6_9BACL